MADRSRIHPEYIEQPHNALNVSLDEELNVWDQDMDEPAIFDHNQFAPLVMPPKN